MVGPGGMNEENDPPYENVHVGFFYHTSRKRKKSTVNSYNLISYNFNYFFAKKLNKIQIEQKAHE